ncbi:hypothetical protein Scep_029776 [Stephania cephalantha]|uniref:Uncharacterized protein n=1 Tax=Stephania cephalantha TaxID=152367 RepID=A0AAP0DYB9_9MAGN
MDNGCAQAKGVLLWIDTIKNWPIKRIQKLVRRWKRPRCNFYTFIFALHELQGMRRSMTTFEPSSLPKPKHNQIGSPKLLKLKITTGPAPSPAPPPTTPWGLPPQVLLYLEKDTHNPAMCRAGLCADMRVQGSATAQYLPIMSILYKDDFRCKRLYYTEFFPVFVISETKISRIFLKPRIIIFTIDLPNGVSPLA